MGPGCLGDFIGAIDMDLIDKLPVLVGHFGEAGVSQNTSVIDHNINATKVVDGRLHNAVALFN